MGGATMRRVNLAPAKGAVAEELAPGHPGREALLALPDEVPATQFDAVFPLLVRLLKAPVGDARGREPPPGHGGTADAAGQPRF